MDFMIVYIILRKISEWFLSTFYSGVYVQGEENVPQDGPLIICANHHNELIDIATLTATVPHRRQISFWAKANLFKNPILRFILVSSGAIPVHRNPNRNSMRDASSVMAITSRSSRSSRNDTLFLATSRALAGLRPRGGLLNRLVGMFPDRVIGVFPEGTSYTEPRIIQAKEGAALVALEYCRWMRESAESDGRPIKIIPVGISYTDKTQYLSRVYVHYGEPLTLDTLEDAYHSAIESDDNQKARTVAVELTTRIASKLSGLSINAPNWEVLHSAEIARRMLWTDRDLPLKDFTTITNALISLFSTTGLAIDLELHRRAVTSLLAYSGLLHYTNIHHESLPATIPRSRVHAISTFLSYLFKTILHPKFILFLPALVVHIPAYISSNLAARFLATPELPETIALSKVLSGGLGIGVGYACATAALVRTLSRLGPVNLMHRLQLGMVVPRSCLWLYQYGGARLCRVQDTSSLAQCSNPSE
ncbi:hypothetical protein BGY98DRAFT_657926 [Russula aff. rugulosa BPL654]|nr:hypothetical protein BGY98DRAFT_657926 [Russula aff. rugulosa BPL654]